MLKIGVIKPSTTPDAMIKTDDLFQKLSGDKYFTKLDLSKGYWQIPVCHP